MHKKKFSYNAIATVIIACIGLTACDQDKKDKAKVAPPPQAVTVSILKTEPVAITRTLTGKVVSSSYEDVRPQADGTIKDILFTEGSWIVKGQPLYQLDNEKSKAALEIAQASLSSAQAKLNSVSKSSNRSKQLIKINAISTEDYEKSITSLLQAEADVKLAAATLKQQEILLSYSTIKSNISGFVGKSNVTVGALVTTNQAQALTTIQQLDPVYIELQQSSKDLLSIRQQLAGELANHPVLIITDSGEEYEHSGVLSLTDYKTDPSTGNVLLRVDVSNPDYQLLPGMLVKAVVTQGVRENGLLLPQRALQRGARGQASVFVVDEKNTVESKIVTVSNTIGNNWLVEEGLEPLDKVVVEGVQKIGPGMIVNPTEKLTDPEQTETSNSKEE